MHCEFPALNYTCPFDMHAGISLAVVSGDSELTEGETVEIEFAARVLDANSILVLFWFKE